MLNGVVSGRLLKKGGTVVAFFDRLSIDVESDADIPNAFMCFILREYLKKPGVRALDNDEFASGFDDLLKNFVYVVALVRQSQEAISALKLSRPPGEKSRQFAEILDFYQLHLSNSYVCYPAVARHISFFVICLPIELREGVPLGYYEFMELEQTLSDIQAKMNTEGMDKSQIIVSDPKNAIKDMSKAFHQALFSCDYMFNLYPELQIITPLLLYRNSGGHLISPPAEIERLYFESVIKRDFGICRRTLRQIICDSVRSLIAVLGIRIQTSNRMEWTLNLLGVSGSLNDQAGYELHSFCGDVNLCKTLDELLALIDNFFDRLEAYCRKAPQSAADKVEMIVEYIKTNYPDPDLNVNSLCERFNISLEHLSRVFKKITGIKLVDFIHITRLNAAKKLIGDTKLSLLEISQRVGYVGDWTLARAFKRFENMTPSAYRASQNNNPPHCY